MLGLGATNRADAARRGLETATSEAYRVEHPEEYGQVVEWRITDAPSQPSYLEQLIAGTRFDVSRRVHNIRAPTLVLHGGDDRVVPVANAEALAEAIPGAKLCVFEDAGHLVFIERAEEVNKEIISFLKPRGLRKGWESQMSLAKRKTEQLFRRASDANGEAVSFLKPRQPQGRLTSQGPTRQKIKQLVKRVGEVDEEVGAFLEPRISFLKLLKWRRRQRPLGPLTRASQIPGNWVRKLRAGLSR